MPKPVHSLLDGLVDRFASMIAARAGYLFAHSAAARRFSKESVRLPLYQGRANGETVWFVLLDVWAGHPLSTPNMLGTALFKGGSGLMPSAQVEFSLRMVGAFTALHWLAFEFLGALAALLLALAEHNPNLGFGVLLFFVLAIDGLVGGTMMIAEPVLHALAWQSVLVGHLVAAGAMGGYLWRRHAHMVIYP